MDTTSTTPIGARVRQLREDRGLSQHDLAMRADVTTGYISLIERGEAKNPGVETLGKIAKGLGVELKDLFDTEAA